MNFLQRGGWSIIDDGQHFSVIRFYIIHCLINVLINRYFYDDVINLLRN